MFLSVGKENEVDRGRDEWMMYRESEAVHFSNFKLAHHNSAPVPPLTGYIPLVLMFDMRVLDGGAGTTPLETRVHVSVSRVQCVGC